MLIEDITCFFSLDIITPLQQDPRGYEVAVTTRVKTNQWGKTCNTTVCTSTGASVNLDIAFVQAIQENSGYKQSFCLGKKRYLIFAAHNGLIEIIHLKE